MDQENSLSRQDIAKLAAVPDDVLSFWLKRGVMPIANPESGERKHRRFGPTHVLLARFLMVARSAGLNIDTLKALSTEFQDGAASWSRYRVPLEWAGVVLAEAIAVMPKHAQDGYYSNRRDETAKADVPNSVFQRYIESGQLSLEEARALSETAVGLSKANVFSWEIGWSIADPVGAMIFAGQVEWGQWIMMRSTQKPRAIASAFAVAFDFEQIFSNRELG